MSSKQNSFEPDQRIDSIGLEYIEVVLTERFLLPPAALKKIGERVPETLGEISELSGMPFQDVCDVIQECLDIGKDIWLEISDLDTEAALDGTIVVDMRPEIDASTEPLHQSARLFHAQSPQQLLPFLRSLKRVLVLSHSDDHAWSAAMSLRKMDIPAWLPRGWQKSTEGSH